MRCPGCGGGNAVVIDVRYKGTWRRRRYECKLCGARFVTQEIPEEELGKVVRIRAMIARVMRE